MVVMESASVESSSDKGSHPDSEGSAMKFMFELDQYVPETVRISTEWRATFRMARYSASLSEVRISVRSPAGNAQSGRHESVVWVKLASEHRIIVRENSASPAESAHLAIDRAASAVGRYLRRTKNDLILPRGADAESPHQEQP
jgi:hypothetical protein